MPLIVLDETFLDGLREKQRAKLIALITELKKHGPTLPFPYSSQVEGKVRELRTQLGKTRLRILYFADANQVFILLHGIVKDTQKLEASDITTGRSNMTNHENRLKAKEKLKKQTGRKK
jgi:phage-related protein